MTYCYHAYGLALHSDSFIPGLHGDGSVSPRTDLFVELIGEPSWVRDAARLPLRILAQRPASPETEDPAFSLAELGGGQFFQLAYSDGTTFLLDAAATRLWGMRGPSQTFEDLAAYLIGPVMGFVLRRRGKTALHGSAISINGKAILLVGPAGAGKSTTAAALALRGMPVLCEDIVPLEEVHGGFAVRMGHRFVCLWPDSVNLLFGNPDALPRLSRNWDKRYLVLEGSPSALESETAPLGAVFFLDHRVRHSNAPRVEDLASRELLLMLVQNTYMNWLLNREQRAAEFDVLTRLLSDVPGRRIIPHEDPASIGPLCDLILGEASRLLINPTLVHSLGR